MIRFLDLLRKISHKYRSSCSSITHERHDLINRRDQEYLVCHSSQFYKWEKNSVIVTRTWHQSRHYYHLSSVVSFWLFPQDWVRVPPSPLVLFEFTLTRDGLSPLFFSLPPFHARVGVVVVEGSLSPVSVVRRRWPSVSGTPFLPSGPWKGNETPHLSRYPDPFTPPYFDIQVSRTA